MEYPIRLVRALNLNAQVLCKRARGSWVLQELRRSEDYVRLALIENFLRVRARLNASDRADKNALPMRLFDGLCEVRLVCWCNELDLLSRIGPTGGHVDEVDAVLCYKRCETDSIF